MLQQAYFRSQNSMTRLSHCCAVLLFSTCFGLANAAQLEWSGDFEEGQASIDGSSDADFIKKLRDEGVNAVADVQGLDGMAICGAPREGNFAGRTMVLEDALDIGVRAEIMTQMPGRYHFNWDGPEYWIGLSLCLAEWPPGSDVYTMLQIHAPNEEKGSPCDFAGNALSIAVRDDIGQIRVIDNPTGVSSGKGAFSNAKSVYSYNLRETMGEWQDFVFRIRLSTTGDGYYTAWHDGQQVASEAGLVNVNWKDSCGQPIPKTYHNGLHVGFYGGPNSAGKKVLYIDSARIAVGENGYTLVAPGGEQVARPNPPPAFEVD